MTDTSPYRSAAALDVRPAARRALTRLADHVRLTAQRHGLGCALRDVAVRAVNRLAVCRILKVLVITTPDPAYTVTDSRYRCGFLERAELATFSGAPEYELPGAAVDQALECGDACFGIVDGGVLASYGWYSSVPDQILPGVELHFDPRYVYMHKGFTHPRYRGQRLHAIGMTLALQAYRAKGCEGLVSYVESTNVDSLKSVYRMGYRDCGTLYVAGVRGRYLLHGSASARAWGFHLEKTPAARTP